MDGTISAVYTNNYLPRVRQKVGQGPSLKIACTIHTLESRVIFYVRLRYCACDQRNYFTSWQKRIKKVVHRRLWSQTKKTKTKKITKNEPVHISKRMKRTKRTPSLTGKHPFFPSCKQTLNISQEDFSSVLNLIIGLNMKRKSRVILEDRITWRLRNLDINRPPFN